VIAVLLGTVEGCGGDGGHGKSATREGTCARTTGRHSVGQGVERLANPVGRGPVYVSLGMEALPPSSRGVATLRDDHVGKRGYYHKTLWAVAPGYDHSVEVRGRMIGERRTALLFQTGDERLRLSRVLRLPASGGWRATPSTTVIPRAGCFAFEIKGPELTQRILFEATR
jgi:hypothetical protein